MMSARVQSTIILIAWGVLLGLYALNKHVTKIRFLRAPIVVDMGSDFSSRPGSFLSGAGVVFVFMINIATIGLVFASALSPSIETAVSWMRLEMPLWIHMAGGVWFVLYSLWGLLVLFYNLNYTPLYQGLTGQYVIVTEGPYRLVRHPRYAAAALANVGFFLFTGFWISLLGVLGWAAVYAQAQAEERFLLALAPEAYGAYHRRTGMFFPRIFLDGRMG